MARTPNPIAAITVIRSPLAGFFIGWGLGTGDWRLEIGDWGLGFLIPGS
ncbi:MAG: hypothetical protein ABIG63_17610 [Chloroflexota bacterium]